MGASTGVVGRWGVCKSKLFVDIYVLLMKKRYRARISVKYELLRQVINIHFDVEKCYLCIGSGKKKNKPKTSNSKKIPFSSQI